MQVGGSVFGYFGGWRLYFDILEDHLRFNWCSREISLASGMIFSDFWWIWGGDLGSLWGIISDLFVLGDGENAALVGSLLFRGFWMDFLEDCNAWMWLKHDK